MTAKQHYQPTILVTGCTSGVGLAMAQLLYSKPQYRVCITGRGHSLRFLQQRFQQNDRFLIRALDVTRGSDREQLIKELTGLWGGVDILVNNAGISYRSVVEHMSELDEDLQMNTNYRGPMALTRLVLPGMRDKGRGKIINVSSVSGMLAMPTMASYSASKHALEGASEALWYEARPFGINVSLIQPGFIRSDSFERVHMSAEAQISEASEDAYSKYYQKMRPFISRFMNRSLATPESVAQVILNTIQKQDPNLWVSATWDATLFYHLRRMVPRSLLLPILFRALPSTQTWALSHTRRRSPYSLWKILTRKWRPSRLAPANSNLYNLEIPTAKEANDGSTETTTESRAS